MSHKIRKSLLGKYEVHFACSGCGETTICPISDAGTQQPCPSCGKVQVVPGETEKRKVQEASFLAEEAARKQRVEEQVNRERERKRAVEHEAARRFKQNSEAQNVLEADQDAIRTADWADRLMWKAFSVLRRLFALQLVLGIVGMVLGAVALVIAVILALGQLSHKAPDYADATKAVSAGILLIVAGYGLYVTAAMCATIVYIERNTRGILRN